MKIVPTCKVYYTDTHIHNLYTYIYIYTSFSFKNYDELLNQYMDIRRLVYCLACINPLG